MFGQSLEDTLKTAGNPVSLLREFEVDNFSEVPPVCTNWIEEQRAWRETCSFFDQSYHMANFHISGSDALDLLSDVGVNNFQDFNVGQAKQLVVCNPDGHLIGDTILFHLNQDRFLSVGLPISHQWLMYHAETGEYDVETEFQNRPVAIEDDPWYFRYQLQGPNAVPIMEEITDEPLSSLPFFNFDTITINDHEVNALRHGMSGERGFELWGSYSIGEDVKDTIMTVGSDYGIRELGTKSYLSSCAVSGWLPHPLPAIFDNEEMEGFRKWLDSYYGIIPLGGSFYSEEISDYYLTPHAVGYNHLVDLNHDFIGKKAIEGDINNQILTKVTLVWNPQDVLDVFASLFDHGNAYKFLELPHSRWSASHYDEVVSDESTIGVSKWTGYTYNERAMISLACIHIDHSDVGEKVTIKWGDQHSPENRLVESHANKEIEATVAEVPFTEDRR